MDLVTGGTGIVGVHVLNELLVRGRSVRALYRPTADRELVRRVLKHYHADGDNLFQRIQWVPGDLLDPLALAEAMHGAERVFHCAALVSFDPRDAKAMFLHNIQGTANVVNAMLATGTTRLCHVSSTATIGAKPDGSANNEDVPFVSDKHASPYAVSKHEAELEVQRGIAEGLHAVMVNPCVIIGPGPAGRSSMTIIERMRKGSRFYPRGSNAVVDARDVASAMVRLLEEGTCGERYLLVGENLSYQRLFGVITTAFGMASPRTALSPWMLELAWRLEAMRTLLGGRPMITRISARTASRTRNYDGSRAAALMGQPFRSAEVAVKNVADFLTAQ
ncbi:MAG: NAD-dependent epimerase/dehydratase family protein [Flavobacteriales bacterium]|nr:NAD-dependent epimerase/dehydratase family protein [Flavobacteriales bacterium]